MTREFWLGAGAAVAAGFVTCVGLVTTWPAVGSATTDYSISSERPSPTGERRAILYTGMGGGAAGWCYQYLAVVQVGASFDPKTINSELEYVFSASCGSRVSPRWISERELEVSYSLDAAAGTSLYQRAFTRDGLVRLSFVAQR